MVRRFSSGATAAVGQQWGNGSRQRWFAAVGRWSAAALGCGRASEQESAAACLREDERGCGLAG